jgi:hypothetical protein
MMERAKKKWIDYREEYSEQDSIIFAFITILLSSKRDFKSKRKERETRTPDAEKIHICMIVTNVLND